MQRTLLLVATSFLAVCATAGTAAAQSMEGAGADGRTDHQRFSNTIGIGLLGSGTIPIGDGSVSAPIVGMRAWLRDDIGREGGLGVRFAGSASQAGDTTTSIPEPLAIAIHGGLPLLVADSQHFAFQFTPEMDFGFAANTLEGDPDDTVQRGLMFALGARMGGELHFGFVGIPELSLRANVGVALQYSVATVSVGDVDSGQSSWSFGTTGGTDPWDFLRSSVSALYYFGER